MTHLDDHVLSHRFLPLKLACAAYVLAIPLAHGLLPDRFVWEIAAFFLVAMLFTYPLAALNARRWIGVETGVSLGLAALGLVGLAGFPALVVAGIFGHGVWDLCKQRGAGVPFFGWYVTGCVTVDWLYAAALALHLVR